MRHLVLFRHAKSNWSDAAADDHDRPLADRGKRAAPVMGALLRQRGWMPDLVLCSTAERARATWRAAAAACGYRGPLLEEADLYMADVEDLFARVRRLPTDCRRVLLVGHNPGLQAFALELAGADTPPTVRARLETKFPTAALAHFQFNGEDWSDLAPGACRLTEFVAPRDVRDG